MVIINIKENCVFMEDSHGIPFCAGVGAGRCG